MSRKKMIANFVKKNAKKHKPSKGKPTDQADQKATALLYKRGNGS